MSRYLTGKKLLELPKQTMLGALVHYITQADMRDFQPMKANFGILPSINGKGKRERAKLYAQQAKTSLEIYLSENFSEL